MPSKLLRNHRRQPRNLRPSSPVTSNPAVRKLRPKRLGPRVNQKLKSIRTGRSTSAAARVLPTAPLGLSCVEEVASRPPVPLTTTASISDSASIFSLTTCPYVPRPCNRRRRPGRPVTSTLSRSIPSSIFRSRNCGADTSWPVVVFFIDRENLIHRSPFRDRPATPSSRGGGTASTPAFL